MNKIEEVSLEIKKRREELGLYQEYVVDKLKKEGVDISISALSRIESMERQKIDTALLIALSKVLKKDFIKMLGHKTDWEPNVYEVENNIPKYVTLPVYGMASAGTGALDYDVVMEEFILPADFEVPKDSFIIGVYGESMEPIFYDGDRIMVDTSKRGTEWQFLVDYPVVVQINEERFVKVVKFNNYKPEFHSLNQMYAPITVTNGDEIILVGVVTEILKRKIGKIKL